MGNSFNSVSFIIAMASCFATVDLTPFANYDPDNFRQKPLAVTFSRANDYRKMMAPIDDSDSDDDMVLTEMVAKRRSL